MTEMRNVTRSDQNQNAPATLPTRLPHVVIVGAGFAGLEVARGLAEAPVQVTVIDRTNHHLFQPLLYQVATAYLSPADISAPIRNVLRGQANTEVLLGDVTGVNTTTKEVQIGSNADSGERTISYDYLVLATGAGQSYFGHDEWAEFASGLKTVGDATSIRRKILLAFEAAEMETDPEKVRALLTFVVVGGGPTGVEMAGAIAELAHKAILGDFRHINAASARVLLVEALGRILPTFPEGLAKRAGHHLQELGVEVRTQSPVENVDAEGVVIAGQRLPARTVVWAAGVKASPAGEWLGAKTDRAGRVVVQSDLSVPGQPDIFVIGDTSSLTVKGKPLPGVAPVAMQEGEYVARLISSRLSMRPLGPFRYRDKGYLATVGRLYAIGYINRLQFSGTFGWFVWAAVHIFYLIGFRNRVLVMMQWAWAYFTYQRGARLITPDNMQQDNTPRQLRAPSAV